MWAIGVGASLIALIAVERLIRFLRQRQQAMQIATDPTCLLCRSSVVEQERCPRCGYEPHGAGQEIVAQIVLLNAARTEFEIIFKRLELAKIGADDPLPPTEVRTHEVAALDFLRDFPEIVIALPTLNSTEKGSPNQLGRLDSNAITEDIRAIYAVFELFEKEHARLMERVLEQQRRMR